MENFINNFLLSPFGSFASITSFILLCMWLVHWLTKKVTGIEYDGQMLKDNQKRMEDNLLRMEDKMDALAETVTSQLKNFDVRLANMGASLNERFVKMENQVNERCYQMESKVDQKLTVMEDKFDKKLTVMEDNFDKKLSVMEDKFDNKLSVMEEKFDKKLSVMEEKFDNKLSVMEEKFDNKLSAMENRFDRKLSGMEDRFAHNMTENTQNQDAKIDELKKEVASIKLAFDLSKLQFDAHVSESHSPQVLTELGNKIAEELNADDIISRNWERIKENLDNNIKEPTPYDIQQYCLDTALVDIAEFVDSGTVMTLKFRAYMEGKPVAYFSPIFGLKIRDRYMAEIGLNVPPIKQ